MAVRNNSEEYSMVDAMELWKRVFDWTGNPFVAGKNEWDRICYFCGEDKPYHVPGCSWIGAKELVEADEKGLVE